MAGARSQAEEDNGIAALEAKLRDAGLIASAASARFIPLTGGVASDIWKVETDGTPFVVKRALPKLRVAADWFAPVSRNAAEAGWLRQARRIVPTAAPEVLFHDPEAGLFAMNYFPPDDYPVWKEQLRDGHVDIAFAAKVGQAIARIHTATAGDEAIARAFANDATFHAIRLEPYLEATAAKYPALADTLFSLSRSTLGRKRALVHGDVSPKNILAGPEGPLFLDAECAWYGDPAFDLAFCLNHLLLKGLWNRAAGPRFLAAFDALVAGYFDTAAFEPRAALEGRTAALLPALFLARVDGKSPAEYVTREADRDLVRATAIPLIENPRRLHDVRAAWAKALGQEQ